MDTLYTIDLDDNYRIDVSQDFSGATDNPASWLDESAVVYDCGGLSLPHGRSGYCYNDDEADTIADAVAYYDDDWPETIGAALTRHYARKGWDCLVRNVYPGRVYDIYTEFIAVAPGNGTAHDLARLMSQWRDGDVYVLELQRRTKCPYCHTVEWQTLDALGGVYGDDVASEAAAMASAHKVTSCAA